MTDWRRLVDLFVVVMQGLLVGFSFSLPLASLAALIERTHGPGHSHTIYASLVALYAAGTAVGAFFGGKWLVRRRLRGRQLDLCRIPISRVAQRARRETQSHHAPLLVADSLALIG